MTYAPDTTADEGRTAALHSFATVAATERGACLIDHGSRTVDELNADTIRLAIDAGWRGASAEDFREIRRVLTVAAGDALLTFWHPSATDEGLSEALGWLADDAVDYLSELAPDGFYVGNDGEAGGLMLAPIDA